MVGRGFECAWHWRIGMSALNEYVATRPAFSPERRQLPTNCSLSRSPKAQLGLFLVCGERACF